MEKILITRGVEEKLQTLIRPMRQSHHELMERLQQIALEAEEVGIDAEQVKRLKDEELKAWREGE